MREVLSGRGLEEKTQTPFIPYRIPTGVPMSGFWNSQGLRSCRPAHTCLGPAQISLSLSLSINQGQRWRHAKPSRPPLSLAPLCSPVATHTHTHTHTQAHEEQTLDYQTSIICRCITSRSAPPLPTTIVPTITIEPTTVVPTITTYHIDHCFLIKGLPLARSFALSLSLSLARARSLSMAWSRRAALGSLEAGLFYMIGLFGYMIGVSFDI